jgi:hypothetical protein
MDTLKQWFPTDWEMIENCSGIEDHNMVGFVFQGGEYNEDRITEPSAYIGLTQVENGIKVDFWQPRSDDFVDYFLQIHGIIKYLGMHEFPRSELFCEYKYKNETYEVRRKVQPNVIFSDKSEQSETHSVIDETHSVIDETHSVIDETHSVIDETHSVIDETHGAIVNRIIPRNDQPQSLHYNTRKRVRNNAGDNEDNVYGKDEDRVYVKNAGKEKGLGVFSKTHFKRGEFVTFVDIQEEITEPESFTHLKKRKTSQYLIGTKNRTWLCSSRYTKGAKDVGSFINTCEPGCRNNCKFVYTNGTWKVVTTRNVNPDTEFLVSYNKIKQFP